jgi:kumamolisin
MLKPRGIRFAQAATTVPPPDQRPWYIPQELADAYQFPPGDGSGQTIAILEFAGTYLPDDLTAFLRLIGMPSAAPNIVVRNVQTLASEDQNDPDATGEVMLDVEVVAALCPKATIVVMFSRWGENGWISNLDAILTDPAAPSIVSVSYGLAEGTDIWTQDAINSINDALQAVANAGITVCVSSGDDGSQDQVADGAAHVDFPASSPYVLSVGGTSLQKTTGTEVVWFEGDGLRADGGGSGGGGVSAFNARPSWQSIPINSVNPHSIEGRIVPDVAANAAGGTGYLIYAPTSSLSSSSAQVAGGTSAATPLWAALLARLQEAGKTIGFITPKLYQPSPASSGSPVGSVALRDITQGHNASGKSPGYSAAVGFDAVTGWGSPNGKNLAEFLP